MKASIYIAAFSVAVAGFATPRSVSAQQCYDSTTCPAGTACINGICQQQVAPPPPGYGASGTVTVQGGAQPSVGVQVQAQQPQGQVYAQPPQQQVYAQPVQQQPVYGQQQPVYAQPLQQPQPRTESGHMTGLIVSGAVVLGASWVTNIIVSLFAGACITSCGPASSDDWDTFRYLGLVPVLGPWIQMAYHPNGIGSDDWGYYLAVDGILQAAGATMLILGIAIPVERTVYADNGESEGFDLAIVPTTNGLGLMGSF